MSRRDTNIILTMMAILLVIVVSRMENSGIADTAYAQPSGDSTVAKSV